MDVGHEGLGVDVQLPAEGRPEQLLLGLGLRGRRGGPRAGAAARLDVRLIPAVGSRVAAAPAAAPVRLHFVAAPQASAALKRLPASRVRGKPAAAPTQHSLRRFRVYSTAPTRAQYGLPELPYRLPTACPAAILVVFSSPAPPPAARPSRGAGTTMPIMPWASPSWPTSLEATGNVVAGVFCVLRNYNSCQPLRSPFLLCRLRLQLRGGGGGETGHVAGATASGGTRTTRPSRQGASVPSSDASVLPRRSLGCAVRKGCGRAASPKGCSSFPHPTRRSFQMGTGSSRVGRCLARGHEPVPGAPRGRLHPSSSKGQPGRRGRGGTRRALGRAGPARVSPHWVSRLP